MSTNKLMLDGMEKIEENPSNKIVYSPSKGRLIPQHELDKSIDEMALPWFAPAGVNRGKLSFFEIDSGSMYGELFGEYKDATKSYFEQYLQSFDTGIKSLYYTQSKGRALRKTEDKSSCMLCDLGHEPTHKVPEGGYKTGELVVLASGRQEGKSKVSDYLSKRIDNKFGELGDMDYFNKKMIRGLRIPKEFLETKDMQVTLDTECSVDDAWMAAILAWQPDDRIRFNEPLFDELTHGLKPGSVTVIGAPTGVGRTSLLMKLARSTNVPFLFGSSELASSMIYNNFAEHGTKTQDYAVLRHAGINDVFSEIGENCRSGKENGKEVKIIFLDDLAFYSDDRRKMAQQLRRVAQQHNVAIVATTVLSKHRHYDGDPTWMVSDTSIIAMADKVIQMQGEDRGIASMKIIKDRDTSSYGKKIYFNMPSATFTPF